MPHSSSPPCRCALVTGGAGFIGSHLVDTLLAQGVSQVRVFDNLSSGREAFLAPARARGGCELIVGDLCQPADDGRLERALDGVEVVFHLAANPDARRGIADPSVDFNLEILATFRLLEAMRRRQVGQLVLASSGTVYGETPVVELQETYGPPLPISVYGAGKLASEGLLSAYAGTFGFQGWIFRFGNVVGPRATHGVLKDLGEQLVRAPATLTVLGNGTQSKPYVHVSDLVEGLLFGLTHARERVNVFNLAVEGATSVRFIAEQLLRAFGLQGRTEIAFGSGDRGWPGDVPQCRLAVQRMAELGWRVRLSSDKAVVRAVGEVRAELAAAHARVVGS